MHKILLVDDHRIVRDGLRVCLEGVPEFEVIGEATDGWEAVERARELQPEIIIMDVGLPGLNGIDTTREILAHAHPAAKIICLSMHSDREFILEALRAGAVGYLLKASAFQELVQCLQSVVDGRTYLSPAVAQIVVDACVRSPVSSSTDSPISFTPRERQVLQMLAEGQSAKEIGKTLNISHKTVHTFRSQIMSKIGVDNLAELTKYAIRHGVVTLR